MFFSDRDFGLSGVRLSVVRRERGERGKPVNNPFERCIAVSGFGLPTHPTLSAVGPDLGLGALCTATAPRGFSYDSLWRLRLPAVLSRRGVGGRVRRSGVSVVQATI